MRQWLIQKWTPDGAGDSKSGHRWPLDQDQTDEIQAQYFEL